MCIKKNSGVAFSTPHYHGPGFAANDGLEPEDGLMRLGLWGATEMGTFTLAPYYVHMSDLLKYNTIYNTIQRSQV